MSLPKGFRATEAKPDPRLGALLLCQREAISYDDLATWLDNLAGPVGGRLLCLKGLAAIHESDAPLLVQSVGTLFSDRDHRNAGSSEIAGQAAMAAEAVFHSPDLESPAIDAAVIHARAEAVCARQKRGRN